MTAQLLIGPSILTADFLNLGRDIATAQAAGVDYLHLDIMDGQFVPNISFGMPIVSAIRTATELPLDVHLMINTPEAYIGAFAEAGADTITIQVEATIHTHRVVTSIREHGVLAGVALCPGTPIAAVEELLPFVDQVLVMSVNPGFGGQTFIPTALAKIERLRGIIADRQLNCRIQVDGGIKATNIARVASAGAESFVVGSSVFDGKDRVAENVAALRSALAG